jgi:hypothetical protein
MCKNSNDYSVTVRLLRHNYRRRREELLAQAPDQAPVNEVKEDVRRQLDIEFDGMVFDDDWTASELRAFHARQREAEKLEEMKAAQSFAKANSSALVVKQAEEIRDLSEQRDDLLATLRSCCDRFAAIEREGQDRSGRSSDYRLGVTTSEARAGRRLVEGELASQEGEDL